MFYLKVLIRRLVFGLPIGACCLVFACVLSFGQEQPQPGVYDGALSLILLVKFAPHALAPVRSAALMRTNSQEIMEATE